MLQAIAPTIYTSEASLNKVQRGTLAQERTYKLTFHLSYKVDKVDTIINPGRLEENFTR